MIACPNPNTPEWKTLVAAIGEENATRAFVRNNNEIPTVEQAARLLAPRTAAMTFAAQLEEEQAVRSALEMQNEQFSEQAYNREMDQIQRAYGFRENTTYISRQRAEDIVKNINAHSRFVKASMRMVGEMNQFYQISFAPKQESFSEITRTIDSMSAQEQQENMRSVQSVIRYMQKKFPNVKVNWVDPNALATNPKFFGNKSTVNPNRINAFVKGSEVYLVQGRVTPEVVLEEFLHFFTEAMRQQRAGLFGGLFREAQKAFPELWAEIQRDYPSASGFTETDRKSELVTRVLSKELRDEIINNPEGRDVAGLKKFLRDVYNWVIQALRDMFSEPTPDGMMTLEVGDLNLNLTFEEVAAIINTREMRMYNPTFSEVMFNLENKEKDDEASETQPEKSSTDRKIERIDEQLANLEKVLKKSTLKTAQREVIQKIKDNMEAYKRVLRTTPGKTTSVTTLIGAYDSPNAEKSKDFANFGTFMHAIMEELQLKSIATKNTVNPIVLMNREFFDELYEKTQADEKTKFKISNLDQDMMYDIAVDMVSRLSPYYNPSAGYVVLPEMTVTGSDAYGNVIVGRIDFMAIDPKGNVNVVDLKTTKLDPGEPTFARLKRNLFKIKADRFKEGVFRDFANINARSKVMTFDMQMSVYQQMLGQMGVNVDEKTVIGLVYTGKASKDDDFDAPFAFDKYAIHTISDKDYAYEPVDPEDPDGEVTLNRNFLLIRQAAQNAIPVKGQQETKERVQGKADNLFEEVDPAKLSMLMEKIQGAVADQLRMLSEEKRKSQDVKADPEVMRAFDEREAQLLRVQKELSMEATSNEAVQGLKLSAVVQGFAVIAEQLEAESIRLSSKELTPEEQSQVFDQLNKQVVNLQAVIDTMRQLALNAGLNSNNELLKYLTNIDTALKVVHQRYVELGRNALIDIIRKQNPEKYSEILYAQKNAYNEARVNYVKDQLQRVQDPNWKPSFFGSPLQRITLRGEKLEKERQARIQQLEAELADIERDMQDMKLTDERIAEYVSSVFMNEKSKFYLGGSINVDMGFTLDDVIASVSNSELAIASIANYLRELTEQGYLDYFNEVSENKIDSLIQNFIKAAGGEAQANQQISEVVTINVYRPDGKVEQKQYRSFINPITQEYRDVFEQYYHKMNILRKEINTLRSQVEGQPSDQELKDKMAVLRAERSRLRKEHLDWMLENTVTFLKPEVYKLQLQLPDEVSEALEEIDEEVRKIVEAAGGYGNEESWHDSDFDQLHQLELQRRKIMYEAVKDNPEYQAILEKYNEFFYYDYNRSFFNRLDAEKKAKYDLEGTPEKYEDWRARNVRRVPTQAYYDDVQRIMDRIARLSDDNPRMGELIREQRRILKKYKVNGRFDTRNMDQQDIELYEELETTLQLYKDQMKIQREGNKLPMEKFKALMNALNELSRISMKRINPLYEQEYSTRFNGLRQRIAKMEELQNAYGRARNPKQAAKFQEEYLYEEKQFENDELNFKQWYDRNHNNVYELGTLTGDKKLNPLPKKFHFETVPALEKHYEEVPSERYRVRRYKDEAFNPEYQESVEGYPMVKGMKIVNGKYEVNASSKYINPAFIKLQQNPTAYAFYNQYVLDNFVNKQSATYGAKLGFLFPGVQQPGIENIANHGLKEGLKREWKEKVNELTLNTSEIERSTNEFGVAGQMRVRFRYNYPMDADITTSDGINAVMLWNLEAGVNKQMGKADLVMSPVIAFLENARVNAATEKHSKQIQKVLDIVKFERNKFVYGQTFRGAENPNQVMNRKTLRMFMQVVSFGRLGFDIAMQTGNMISGNVQMYIASIRDTHGNWDESDLLWSKKELYSQNGWFAKLIGDYGKVGDVSFQTKFYRMVNPTMKDMSDLVDLSTKTFSRRLLNRALSLGNISFMIQDKGEMEIGLTTMLAVYHHAKFKKFATNADGSFVLDANGDKTYELDSDGNIVMVNGIEAFGEDASGRIIRRPDVDITEDDARMLKRKVFNQITEIQGNYADYTKTHIEGDILGMLLLYYRKYFPSALSTRFGRARDNWENAEYKVGWYRVVWDMIFKYYGFTETMKSMLPGFIAKKVGGTKVNEFYRTRAQRAGREVVAAFMMMVLFNALRKMIFDDDDEEEIPWVTAQFARTFAKVANETRALVPLPKIGKMEDYVDNFTTFTTAFREGKTLAKFANNGINWMLYETTGGEDYYEQAFYQRRYGPYEKGDAKVLKNFNDLTGYDNIQALFEPGYKVKEQYRNR